MTRFEEITDIIDSKKRFGTKRIKNDEDIQLEVSGLSPSSDNPLAAWGDEETDPDIIDMLYRSYRSRPNRGEGAYQD